MIAFACAVAFAGYFISTLYMKFYRSPVIISFSPVDGTLDSFPFPAITVCNMNQAVKKEAEDIVKNGQVFLRSYYLRQLSGIGPN